MKYSVYAILDYDGYVCKSFYANKDNPMDVSISQRILNDLVDSAIEKTARYYNVSKNSVGVLKIMSGHSWKKDVYPSYKRTRKKNEYLGAYRDLCKEQRDVITVPQLEADEVIVTLVEWFRDCKNKFVVFSDDKDLRYYSEINCRINITEEIIEDNMLSLYQKQIVQMLVGDKEDNIKGIPSVGEKTAIKLLDIYGYSLDGVIKCYKDKNIDIDNCLRELLLVIPLSSSYLKDSTLSNEIAINVTAYGEVDNLDVYNAIISQIQYLNDEVTRIYNEV